MKNTEIERISVALSSRYGLPALNYKDWDEMILFGGIGMDLPTFEALAVAAMSRGDAEVTVYELESSNIEFPPVPIRLRFDSFNQLKANTVCLFEIALLPPSRAWVALLTDDLETFIYGPREFLAKISKDAPPGMQMANKGGGKLAGF